MAASHGRVGRHPGGSRSLFIPNTATAVQNRWLAVCAQVMALDTATLTASDRIHGRVAAPASLLKWT